MSAAVALMPVPPAGIAAPCPAWCRTCRRCVRHDRASRAMERGAAPELTSLWLALMGRVAFRDAAGLEWPTGSADKAERLTAIDTATDGILARHGV